MMMMMMMMMMKSKLQTLDYLVGKYKDQCVERNVCIQMICSGGGVSFLDSNNDETKGAKDEGTRQPTNPPFERVDFVSF
jgi:hypothetical protein